MRYRRTFRPGCTFFFTVATEGRRPVLIEHIDRHRLAFRRVRERRPFELEAIVVRPDHLHALWRLPDGDSDYATRWMAIKRFFSSGVESRPANESQRKKRERGVWQRRYWERAIRDVGDWTRHLNYIHYNPVKHGYCSAPGDWQFGSFRRYVERGWYGVDWGRVAPPEIEGLELE